MSATKFTKVPEKLLTLLRHCPQWGEFRASHARCEGYRHPISVANGLRALERRGLASSYWFGNEQCWRLTDAGRAQARGEQP